VAIEGLVPSRVEACSEYHGKVVATKYHPFVGCVHVAFAGHRPLVLSPDMFWLLICQGFARHVNHNAEQFRSLFVRHSGKAKIEVRRDDFFKGSPENPWAEVFGEFSAGIRRHIGEENHANIVASFSTTGAIETAANEIVLMDSMKSFFDYHVSTLCGIPEVTLEGTADDWRKLCERTQRLGTAYDLAWWTDRITPVLKRIARNATGKPDSKLWKSIYKVDNGSGGPFINGWIVDFFPYLRKIGAVHKQSNELTDWREVAANPDQYRNAWFETPNWRFSGGKDSVTTEDLPGSLCKVPFTWHYLKPPHPLREYAMEFIAGFIGFTQDAETLAVRPKIGGAVQEVPKKVEPESTDVFDEVLDELTAEIEGDV